jgi:hypothetical protein
MGPLHIVSHRPPVELSDSVILVSYADMEPVSINGRRLRVCTEVVRKSAKWGAKRISMVVTPHWIGGRRGKRCDYQMLRTYTLPGIAMVYYMRNNGSERIKITWFPPSHIQSSRL